MLIADFDADVDSVLFFYEMLKISFGFGCFPLCILLYNSI